jgi:hypothetical protein
MRVQFIKKSSNAKTGPIPVTVTERASCPEACPLAGAGGCYAESGFHTRLNWDKVSNGTRGGTWDELCASVDALPDGTLWRHNIAGDLPGAGNTIDAGKLEQLTKANEGKRGFTYTHYPTTAENLQAISRACDDGFTVNLSANNPAHAVQLSLYGLPVASVVPIDHGNETRVIDGIKFITCPATYREDITCASCKLCSLQHRDSVIAFPAHGARKNSADIIARG